MNDLLSKLTGSETRVAVIGMGYVGLPLALVIGEAGLSTVGLDIDSKKIASLCRGESYIHHIDSERIAGLMATGRFSADSDFSHVSSCDAIIICVPTPLDHHLQPDLTFIEATCRNIAPHLSANTLVVLESTTWPGTTAEVVAPLLLEGSKLEQGESLYIAYSPEREDPGNRDFGTKTIPKLVGGVDAQSTELAVALYRRVLDQVIPVGDSRVAESAKLFENIFRSVNIALVNEMKMILDPMGIDVWQVIQAAATKPFGFMPFWPGPGLGGHCIPIDPFYLSWKAKEFGTDTRFIELAGQINRAMPEWVIRKAQDCLNDHGKPIKGSRVLVLGMAYKTDVDDMRESPSLVLMELLEERGAQVEYFDPWIPVIPTTREHAAYAGRTSVDPTADFDCFILATAHTAFKPEELLVYGVPIIDTRNLFPADALVTKA